MSKCVRYLDQSHFYLLSLYGLKMMVPNFKGSSSSMIAPRMKGFII